MALRYFCRNELRREAIREAKRPDGETPLLNGIDYLEVSDDQKTLRIHFIHPIQGVGADLNKENILITGGERIRKVQMTGEPVTTGCLLTLKVQEPGDFSIYTLRLVRKDDSEGPPPEGFDPILSSVDFSFKAGCPSDFDCRSEQSCPDVPRREPDIDYLAKDYASFRQLMLDRLAVQVPGWKERSPADMGVALVELFAYVGDRLSYRQDAIAAEAYLGTARRRTSVRRHARLVDYFMHDGCNARAWVQVRVNDSVTLAKNTLLLTALDGIPDVVRPGSADHLRALSMAAEVFATMQDVTLDPDHNDMAFHAWGAQECCLPKGATRATLRGELPNLKDGDVLVFSEKLGAGTGEPADIDPARRHAVRLVDVSPAVDPLGGFFQKNPTCDPLPVTEIEWDAEDALPFPFCVSAQTEGGYREGISVALGNIVLADHGCPVEENDAVEVPIQLSRPMLTQATVYSAKVSARSTMLQDPADALPSVTLVSQEDGLPWQPQRDLLNSSGNDPHFVVETEADGTARVRFGDGTYGRRPDPESRFSVSYRIGNGARGNVGAEAIRHIVTTEPGIACVINPLPARGGIEAESIEEVRQKAPFAFRTQERAVTAEDYARLAEQHRGVQRAVASFRWTGSWRTVFVTVDRIGGEEVDIKFKEEMLLHLEPYRLAGHDVEIDGPRYVSLEIEMGVCVEADHFRDQVKKALLELFSSRILPDGRRGVFHPDNFTFGQTVYLSPLYAAAQAVEGVSSVQISVFQRQGHKSEAPLNAGKLALGRLEIARLDNDPNFPERGVLRLNMEGGK